MGINLSRLKEFIETGKGKRVLHLGCNVRDLGEGLINVDYARFPGVDLLADLDQPLPFADASVDGIGMAHVLEHLRYMRFMREALRILKPGKRVYLVVPYYTSHAAHIGEHVTPGFAWIAFDYFQQPNHPFHAFKVCSNRIVFRGKLKYLNPLVNCFPRFYDKWLAHLLPAVELEVVLEKRA
ncbi:MAG TPA: methyltransferase domain-containing protein [Candidatus Diapherotrites archaeon]|uniref:Methyltransferase domain-containing protein n=1 Tax=Candidatus Iainarchaeum sp. TaxID=3101447 RepID=A0A7J4JKP3_9ARCH|nr:methyltransferase domain-containing protein [Candidatus Diapherotrites archaeon]HIH16487.1 methyltransferase domain-containing protein [Candidatus Diapherotrites archaeon]